MTKRKHQFAGEHEASQIVSWLNSGQSAGRQRIAEIVEIYNKLGTGSPVLWRTGEERVGPKWELSLERGALGRRLQKLLDRYHFKFAWFGQRTILAPTKKLTGDAFKEFYCVPPTHRLRQMDMLARVRRCGGCKKWMFAKLPGQRFCSESCRIKAYQSDRQWQARNNAKRRKTYHDNKLRKVRLLERRDEL